MKFEREETPTIMDGLVVRWTFNTGWVNKPEISASRNGVCISGAWPTLQGSVAFSFGRDETLEIGRAILTLIKVQGNEPH